MSKFEGTKSYLADEALRANVNVAIALGRPLLVKGEPGTGKTLLAGAIAESLGKRLLIWNIKSTSKAIDGCYIYDTVQRLHDSRFGDKDVSDIRQYIRMGPMGEAFQAEEQQVLLVDEIDKADLEFPNDLLIELDQMYFTIAELDETVKARHRPIMIITSNAEKELPDAFLRRCVFHYIEFPSPDFMADIVRVHFPEIEAKLLNAAIKKFYWIRGIDALRKKPSTSELLDWCSALMHEGVSFKNVEAELPFLGTLIKKETDYREVNGRHDRAASRNSWGGN